MAESSPLLSRAPRSNCCGRISLEDVVGGHDNALKGKVAIVTGANSGIGRDTVRGLALMGCHVILAGRSLSKLDAAKEEIAALVKDSQLTVLRLSLDLGSLESIKSWVKLFLDQGLPLHLLVNNAGLFSAYDKTKDGLDMVAGTNWFGGFALTHLLLDKLKASAPARIVNVSSKSHVRAGNVENTEEIIRPSKAQYNMGRAYANSKLLNVLHTFALSRSLEGTGVTAYSMHPGFVYTGIAGGLGSCANCMWGWIFCWGACPCIRTVSQGSSTVVYLCVARTADLKNGLYYVDCRPVTIEKRGDDIDLANKWYEKGLTLMDELSQQKTATTDVVHEEKDEGKKDV